VQSIAKRWLERVLGEEEEMRKNYDDEIFADPDPSEANTDATFYDELYSHFRDSGLKPEAMPYLPDRKKYQKWLDKQAKKDEKLEHKP
jgi:hypothetical protein